jgi:transcriptional regulator with XRE-family HTH domain
MKRKRGNRSISNAHRSTPRLSSVTETFGVRLRRYRKRMRYTLAALARDVETDVRTLRRFEWDGGTDTVPDLRLGLRLAHVLGAHPYRLAFGTDAPLASESPRMRAWLDEYEANAESDVAAGNANARPIQLEKIEKRPSLDSRR